MRNNLYICNAKQQQDLLGTHTNIAYCVSSCGTSAPSSRGCLATISRRVRSLFVHTKRKTCFTMPNNNKQAMKVKNSSLSATTIDLLVALSALILGIILFIFAPNFMLAVGKVLGYMVLVAVGVVPFLLSLINLLEDE